MKKISVYVVEQVEGATEKIIELPHEKLASWLWDHDLEVINIRYEEVDDKEAIETK